MGKGVEENSKERDRETKVGGGGGGRGEEEGGARMKEGRGGMWKGEGELPR